MSEHGFDPSLQCAVGGASVEERAADLAAVIELLKADAVAVEDIRDRVLAAGVAEWKSIAGEAFRDCVHRRAGELRYAAEDLRAAAVWLQNFEPGNGRAGSSRSALSSGFR
ncbi:hypothetical protein ACQR35_13140 [Pseudarthrobacter sp. J1738]|uniref:hypothetical protein n=1 Tax=Pseudarthrobacter sp. J1738 TaxID=3420446 RepID=UPI003D2A4DB8